MPTAWRQEKRPRVSEVGRFSALDRPGRLLIGAQRLDIDDDARMRAPMVGIFRTAYLNDRTPFHSMMALPDDLPGIESLDPEGNARPDGERRCLLWLWDKGTPYT